MKKIILILIILILVLLFSMFLLKSDFLFNQFFRIPLVFTDLNLFKEEIKYGEVEIVQMSQADKKRIIVEVADTYSKQKKGLSKREKLDKDRGMLFVFKQAKKYPFWMKDMKFSIDIIWIYDNKIVDITEKIPYPIKMEELPQYQPKEIVNYVLEVNSGFVEENGIKIGDEMKMTL